MVTVLQTKAQKAEQQRQFVEEFAEDVQKRMTAETAKRHKQAANKTNLRYMRQRLAEVQALNDARQKKRDELAEQQKTLQVSLATAVHVK